MFIGREREIFEIKASLSTGRFEATFVYGRRRIGKTELIAQGLTDCPLPILSFEFRKTTLPGNLNLFLPHVKEFFGEPYASFNSFDDLFDYLLKKGVDREYVLVLDEFSFLLSEDFSIESSLAAAIDKYKSSSKVHLFVSGSYVGLMERMMSKESHSYGRFNHIIPLRPFDYFDSAKFYPDYTPEEKVMLYGVFGGVPYFNSLIDTSKSALENIFDLVVRVDSVCEREITETVMAETTKAPSLNELLLIILGGKSKHADIHSEFASRGNGKPDYFLEKLIDMDFVKKTSPINDDGNKRKTRYEIKDNLVDFYYRYLFVAKSRELRKEPKFFFENFIRDDFFSHYVPHKFEKVSREFLIRANFAGMVKPPFFKIGEYFSYAKDAGVDREFDIVTEDKNGYIAYECKYGIAPIGVAVINEEKSQTANLSGIKFYKLGFISKSGFDPEVDTSSYNLFSLNDFYSF